MSLLKDKDQVRKKNEGFLLSSIATAIIDLESDSSDKILKDTGWTTDLPLYQEPAKDDFSITYLSSLEGLLHMLEGESFFFEMTATLQLERFDAFIKESSDSKPIFKILDGVYQVLNGHMIENISEIRIRQVQTALILIGRLVLLIERDTLGRLGAQLQEEMKGGVKPSPKHHYIEAIVTNCITFLAEVEQYLIGFYVSVTNDLFQLNSEQEHDMVFQPWALYAIMEWSIFRPLRMIFVDCVIQKLSTYITNSQMQSSNCMILVIDTASVVAHRLRLELFPTCPIVSNLNGPPSKTKVLAKDKNRCVNATTEVSSVDSKDPISASLLDTLQRRPEAPTLPNILINKTQQRRTAFGAMNRATKNKFRQMFEEWKIVLEQATIGRSIDEPLYCEAIFQLTVIVEQLIQKSHPT